MQSARRAGIAALAVTLLVAAASEVNPASAAASAHHTTAHHQAHHTKKHHSVTTSAAKKAEKAKKAKQAKKAKKKGAPKKSKAPVAPAPTPALVPAPTPAPVAGGAASSATSGQDPVGGLLGTVGGLLGIGSGGSGGSGGGTSGTDTGPTAQVWMTTADGSRQLASADSASFGAQRLSDDIAVDTSATQQRFSGAGASITDSAASVIDTLPTEARTALMTRLFGANGLRLSYLRQPIGASDFVPGSFYSDEDTQGTFDFTRADSAVLPLVQAAKAADPSLRIMGSPWSAPAWMKTSGSLSGGALRDDAVQEYADYLVAVAKHAASVGMPLTDLTVGNEPSLSAGYPSMKLTTTQQAAVLRTVDAGLTAAGLSTQLWVHDDNWGGVSNALDVLSRVSGVARVQGAAFHCYAGDPSQVAQVVSAGWRVYDTECSGTDSSTPAATFRDTLMWQTEHLVISAMRAGAETVMLWNLALDASGGPQHGQCGTACNGVVQIQDGTVTDDAQYDVLGQLTKFVDVGAHVVSSTTGNAGSVEDIAFVNPDGSRAVIVLNSSGASQTFSITADGSSLDYTLPSTSVATFTWKP